MSSIQALETGTTTITGGGRGAHGLAAANIQPGQGCVAYTGPLGSGRSDDHFKLRPSERVYAQTRGRGIGYYDAAVI